MPETAVDRLDVSRPAVAEAVREVMAAAYAVEAEILGVADFIPLRRTSEAIAQSSGRFFGIREEGNLAAVLELEQLAPHHLHIDSLVVEPRFFRRGFATRLVRHAIQSAEKGRLTVSTGAANAPAIALYRAAGFVEERRWQTADGIPMVTLTREAESPHR